MICILWRTFFRDWLTPNTLHSFSGRSLWSMWLDMGGDVACKNGVLILCTFYEVCILWRTFFRHWLTPNTLHSFNRRYLRDMWLDRWAGGDVACKNGVLILCTCLMRLWFAYYGALSLEIDFRRIHHTPLTEGLRNMWLDLGEEMLHARLAF